MKVVKKSHKFDFDSKIVLLKHRKIFQHISQSLFKIRRTHKSEAKTITRDARQVFWSQHFAICYLSGHVPEIQAEVEVVKSKNPDFSCWALSTP